MVTVSEQQSEEKYAELSRHLLRQARDEFGKGDCLQASEKAWGAAAHAMKAAAERRGWNHKGHGLLFAVASQIADDMGDPQIRELLRDAGSLHQNFYEDWQSEASVGEGIERVALLVERMEELRGQPVRPSVVADERQWRRLTEPVRERS